MFSTSNIFSATNETKALAFIPLFQTALVLLQMVTLKKVLSGLINVKIATNRKTSQQWNTLLNQNL